MDLISLPVLVMILVTPCIADMPAAGQDAEVPAEIRDSVVKVITTYRAPDLQRPWTKHPPAEATGTGVIIDGQRILTNAHVAEHASRIQVQPARSTKKYVAEVEAIASGIDLAMLRLRDEAEAATFFADHPALPFRDEIPHAGDDVEVHGYPIGGEQVSVTMGVVSRIDYTMYNDMVPGLTIQIDAAVNPGNSGGPAVHDGHMIGIVFSRMNQAENIGFIIPTEEVRAFLSDVNDGTYDGREKLLFGAASLEADQVRKYLGLDDTVTGVYVFDTEEDREFHGELQDWDVITHIGEYDIDNTGTVEIRSDLRLRFNYLSPHLVDADGNVTLSVWRKGQTLEVKVPTFKQLPLSLPFLGSDYPPYFIYGPLCFMPAYADFLSGDNALVLSIRESPIAERILESPDFENQGFVCVLSPMFTHPIAEGYNPIDLPTLRAVNGIVVRNLVHLVETLRDCSDEWIVFEWYDGDQPNLVFRRNEVENATEEILEWNGIRKQMSEDIEAIWNTK